MKTIRNFTLLLLLINSAVSLAQAKISATKINAKQLPPGIEYEGKLKSGYRWSDSKGDNIAFICETGEYRNPKLQHDGDDGIDAELFAYHFIMKDGKPSLSWKLYDLVSDCPLDLTASFDDFRISDIDKNGIAEVWMVYKTACRGDVSPAEMKLIMYENGKKYAMRGTEKILQGVDENGNKSYDGGEYKFDPAFMKAPAEVRTYA
ncbi:M949_RS01915 family surface polysaccharide biosynthesis protein, partial [Flavobacterium sp.]